MAVRKGALKVGLNVTIPSGPKAEELATLIRATDAIYKILGATILFFPKGVKGGKIRDLPDEFVLRITAFHYGSDGDMLMQGIKEVLDVFPRILEIIRDWRPKKQQAKSEAQIKKEQVRQEQERTKQERERTRATRIENIKNAIAVVKEIRSLPYSEQERIAKMLGRHVDALAGSPIKMLPEATETVDPEKGHK